MPPKNDHWTKGERPPKGLSGRELGMYYRQKQLEKRRQQNFETRNDEEETHQHKQRYNKGKMHVLKNLTSSQIFKCRYYRIRYYPD